MPLLIHEFSADGFNRLRDAAPLREFTITFTGTPQFDSPKIDLDEPGMRERLSNATVTPIKENPGAQRCSVCGEIRSTEPSVFPCRCAMVAAIGPFEDAYTPTGCGCDDNEACGACGTDQADPGPFRSDVFINIEVKALDDMPGWYLATADKFTSQYGDGASPYEALQDFFGVMADHMAFLAKHEHVLARGLRYELDHLQAVAGNDAL